MYSCRAVLNTHLQQIRTWIRNNKRKLLGQEENGQPQPEYLELQEYKAEVHVKRARSARDIFIAEHPEVRVTAEQTARAEGITTRSEITMRVNLAYTEAIKNAPNWVEYEARSNAEKLAKATERQTLKDYREAVKSTPSATGPGRAKYVTIAIHS